MTPCSTFTLKHTQHSHNGSARHLHASRLSNCSYRAREVHALHPLSRRVRSLLQKTGVGPELAEMRARMLAERRKGRQCPCLRITDQKSQNLHRQPRSCRDHVQLVPSRRPAERGRTRYYARCNFGRKSRTRPKCPNLWVLQFSRTQ